jgi:hypothetical protein
MNDLALSPEGPVGVLDSGVGGLSILLPRVIRNLPRGRPGPPALQPAPAEEIRAFVRGCLSADQGPAVVATTRPAPPDCTITHGVPSIPFVGMERRSNRQRRPPAAADRRPDHRRDGLGSLYAVCCAASLMGAGGNHRLRVGDGRRSRATIDAALTVRLLLASRWQQADQIV